MIISVTCSCTPFFPLELRETKNLTESKCGLSSSTQKSSKRANFACTEKLVTLRAPTSLLARKACYSTCTKKLVSTKKNCTLRAPTSLLARKACYSTCTEKLVTLRAPKNVLARKTCYSTCTEKLVSTKNLLLYVHQKTC